MVDFINFNIWLKYHVGILNEGFSSCHAFVYIQVFDGKQEQIPILWRLFSLRGILEVCGIDLVRYIRFEIRTYLGVCDSILTRCFSPLTHLTSESS